MSKWWVPDDYDEIFDTAISYYSFVYNILSFDERINRILLHHIAVPNDCISCDDTCVDGNNEEIKKTCNLFSVF